MSEQPEFGTSGLRGLATALTDDLVARYAAAFVKSFRHNGTVYLGQDKRASSPRIAAAVTRGIASEGCIAVDCGVLPTPALAMASMAQGTSAIMVTGSHIPADRNGLKFYRADGEIDKDDEARLAAAVADTATPGETAASTLKGDAAQTYIARYRDFFGKKALAGLRVGFWAHSSAAGSVLPAALDAMGAETVILGESRDFVSVDTEAIGQDVRARFADWARTHMLDAIVSTDGDADRPLFADGDGVVIPGDVLGPITARVLDASHVVTTVSANTMVDRMEAFRHVARTRIGSPYVIAEMARHAGERVVGYEPNGGFLLGFEAGNGAARLTPLMTRDSLLPILAALVAGRAAGGTARLIRGLPKRRTATDRLKDVPRDLGRGMAEALIAGDLSVLPDSLGRPDSIDTTDGARLTFAGGEIVTVRPSGNAPELRVYVEADSGKVARQILDQVFERIRARL